MRKPLTRQQRAAMLPIDDKDKALLQRHLSPLTPPLTDDELRALAKRLRAALNQ
jgi:hypothetical protein